ncbi:MAG: hypothetical protein HUU55_11630 [Myxococcales bacterium]|nr:hypothetical protein [Myxococcales bacterium]
MFIQNCPRRLLLGTLLFLLPFSTVGCWDEVTQNYLKLANAMVKEYPNEAIAICKQITDVQIRDICLVQVLAKHGKMKEQVVAATLAHESCDEKAFKTAIEAIQDLAKMAGTLGLNSFLPIADTTPIQLNTSFVSQNGTHYSLGLESFAWIGFPQGTSVGQFIMLDGELDVAWHPTETGFAGIILAAEWTASVSGMTFNLALNMDPLVRPSVVLLAPDAVKPGSYKGFLHLTLVANAETLGEIPLVLQMPIHTTDPSLLLQVNLPAKPVPASQILPSWSSLSQKTTDCDVNGIPDWQQIAAGAASDCNLDWIIDKCQKPATVVCVPNLQWFADPCMLAGCPTHSCGPDRGDLTADGIVNVLDVQCGMLAILMSLAENPQKPECLMQAGAQLDMGCDGKFNVADLLNIIGMSLGAPLESSIDANKNGCPDTCDPWTCQDNDPCTKDVYDAQTGCTQLPITCDDGNGCTTDVCLAAVGCVHVPSDMCCGDGVCTDNELSVGDCLQDCALALCTPTSSTPTLGYCDDNGCASKPGRICKAVSDIECKCVKTKAVCGDGFCGAEENCANCGLDCGQCEIAPCMTETKSPGCIDTTCQSCVCQLDPFCCEVQWDSLCVQQAQGVCGKACL